MKPGERNSSDDFDAAWSRYCTLRSAVDQANGVPVPQPLYDKLIESLCAAERELARVPAVDLDAVRAKAEVCLKTLIENEGAASEDELDSNAALAIGVCRDVLSKVSPLIPGQVQRQSPWATSAQPSRQ